jgi:hypothetical protein
VVPAASRTPFNAIMVGWRSVENASPKQPGKMNPMNDEYPRLFADFNNFSGPGVVILNTRGTLDDIVSRSYASRRDARYP